MGSRITPGTGWKSTRSDPYISVAGAIDFKAG